MSKNKRRIQQEVKDLIGQGRYENALEKLKIALRHDERVSDTILLLSGRLSRNQMEKVEGAQSREVLNTELTQIVSGILKLAKQIPDFINEFPKDGNSDDLNHRKEVNREMELLLSYRTSEARIAVKSVLLIYHEEGKARTIGELTRDIGMERRYIAAAVHELEVLELVQKLRAENRTRFVLNDKGMLILSK